MTTALEQVFADALGIDVGTVSDGLAYNSIPQWDSVAHMGLIAQLEDCYGVIDMSSVAKAREILAKYGVAL